jgi:hypothetical protein
MDLVKIQEVKRNTGDNKLKDDFTLFYENMDHNHQISNRVLLTQLALLNTENFRQF